MPAPGVYKPKWVSDSVLGWRPRKPIGKFDTCVMAWTATTNNSFVTKASIKSQREKVASIGSVILK